MKNFETNVIDFYNSLNGQEQKILQILSLCDTNLYMDDFISIIRACFQQISNDKIHSALVKFKDCEFCYYDSTEIELNQEYTNVIVIHFCSKNNHVDEYIEQIEKILLYSSEDLFDLSVYDRNITRFILMRRVNELHEYIAAKKISTDLLLHIVLKSMQYYFIPEVVESFDVQFQYVFIVNCFSTRVTNQIDAVDMLQYYEEKYRNQSRLIGKYCVYGTLLIILGDWKKLEIFYREYTEYEHRDYIPPMVSFLKGDLEQAKNSFKQVLNKGRGKPVNKLLELPSFIAVYYAYACVFSNDLYDFELNVFLQENCKKSVNSTIYAVFYGFIHYLKENDLSGFEHFDCGDFFISNLNVLDSFAIEFMLFVSGSPGWTDRFEDDMLEALKKCLFADGYEILTCQYVNLLKMYASKKAVEFLPQIKDEYVNLSQCFRRKEQWEQLLEQLNSLPDKIKRTAPNSSSLVQPRLIWRFIYNDCYYFQFKPYEQKILKSGKWGKGKAVALKNLPDYPYKTELDKKIIDLCLKNDGYNYYYEPQFKLEHRKALPYMAEHPYLFTERDNSKVELVKKDLNIEVYKKRGGYTISIPADLDCNKDAYVDKVGENKYEFYEITEQHRKLIKIFNQTFDTSIFIPKKGEELLKETIASLSQIVPISSDIKGIETAEEVISVESESIPYIHLLPVGENTLKVEFFVRPFGDKGPYINPGAGRKHLMTSFDGKVFEVKRNLPKEQKLAKSILAKLPTLAIRGKYDMPFVIDNLEETLEVISELEKLASNEVVIEWPEGGKFTIENIFDWDSVTFNAKSQTNWFEIDAKLPVNEELVLSLKELIAESHGKFIRLDKNSFIEITEQLRQKLDGINELAFKQNKDGNLMIHSLNAPRIDEVFEDNENFNANAEWQKQLKKFKKAKKHKPKLPSTFRAELRAYQKEGFEWLSRLAAWGVGACLADDMGLGKTVQALAVILERASKGPSLVVAPSSVCYNWQKEVLKFAPTLNSAILAENDRSKLLKSVKKFDLVIVSYGLLATEIDALKKIKWTNIVLDEAQYIKNAKAKRSKAAHALKGDFKMITTGTPIENHLSELWSLFNFINPGLLSSAKEFNENFANPIEKNQNESASKSLKKMIQPFILRRVKYEVLDELPPKTEINLTVDMSEEEFAFYEALRRHSLEKIQQMKDDKAGTVHLQVLAELMKLRQACCHPRMVDKKINLSSSKLNIFDELVREFLENNHKALVFSQFVSYLKMIRDYCDKNKIKYQYIDGSTPSKERQKRVDAFQSGEGDIFLISLKAGGTGLNLTAADYVIHMDPWWNPAVEDQASDRTHRIGQTRPVTIYRLITKGTVEEKIIALHAKKRDLADSLLAGTDMSAKISLEELVSILQE